MSVVFANAMGRRKAWIRQMKLHGITGTQHIFVYMLNSGGMLSAVLIKMLLLET